MARHKTQPIPETPEIQLAQPQKELCDDLLAFRRSSHYEGVMGFLRAQCWHGQDPFDAAFASAPNLQLDPIRAAIISGTQRTLRLLEIEIEKAERLEKQLKKS